ncbi:hypothetical protein GW765_03770 [Candidatus Parcubacteria bacterium]|nr:hypothetical protein [Candidatus Parcubacteria bacterium]
MKESEEDIGYLSEMEEKRIIYTHANGDLDSFSSVWIMKRRHSLYENAKVVFVSADWDGEGMKEGDKALDIYAGGKGIKGRVDSENNVHSCFAVLVESYCSPEEQKALSSLVRFVDIQDSGHSAVFKLAQGLDHGAKEILAGTSISAILKGFKSLYPDNDKKVMKMMFKVLDGLFAMKMVDPPLSIEEGLKSTHIFSSGNVAIIEGDSRKKTLRKHLFSKGVKVVIYNTGKSIALFRNPGFPSINLDSKEVRQVLVKAGEEISLTGEKGKWFLHKNGFMLAWGTKKAPSEFSSKANAMDLAKAMDKTLSKN